jgi:hypothetical protein
MFVSSKVESAAGRSGGIAVFWTSRLASVRTFCHLDRTFKDSCCAKFSRRRRPPQLRQGQSEIRFWKEITGVAVSPSISTKKPAWCARTPSTLARVQSIKPTAQDALPPVGVV